MNMLNKDAFVMTLLLIVAIVIFSTIIYPRIRAEGFDGEESAENVAENTKEGNEPEMEATSDIIMDGPGFEKSEVEGVSEVIDTIPSNYYFLDDGANGEMSIQHNLYSPSCCSAQYPTPHRQKLNPYVCANKDKFITGGGNYFGNSTFGEGSGCLCMTKEQGRFLLNRGGNGREWF